MNFLAPYRVLVQEVLNRLFYDIINVPLYASISFPGSSLYLLPRILSLLPSQGPLSSSYSGSSRYLLLRVLSLPPSQVHPLTPSQGLSLLRSQGPISTSFPGSSLSLSRHVLSKPSLYFFPTVLSLHPFQGLYLLHRVPSLPPS